MNRTLLVTALIAGAAFGTSVAASAQTATGSSIQRDANQEQRIENGLRNGSITTRENALLQRDESHVDKLQSRELRDGSLSAADKARLNAAQNRASHDINTAEHNGVNGNPLSASSQRAQAQTQRNANQERRIAAGVKDGGLTNREASHLERGESHIDGREYRAGRDGQMNAREQTRVARADDRESRRIHRQRTDGQHRL